MYQFYQIMICLLKFDFFAFIGVTIQLLIVVLQKNSAEFGLTIAAIPVVLFLLVGAGIAVQREIKWLMSISLVLMLAAETYFYKLVRFYEPASSEQYETTRATLTVFTIVAFLCLFTTFAVGLRCLADFDKGLKESKAHGQSYKPVATDPALTKLDLLHDVTARRKKYLSTPVLTPPGEGGEMAEQQGQYFAGRPLQPRISIE
ncbi:hypothetical protein EIP86_004104 [Pleurotus ostreatoroseus]|nr:hypothetical protein EIP86_004104 [Pleurotus ostreatoroseus]